MVRNDNGQSSHDTAGSEDHPGQRHPDAAVAARAGGDGAPDQRADGARGKTRSQVAVRFGAAGDLHAILEIGRPQWDAIHPEDPWNETQIIACCNALLTEKNAGLFVLEIDGRVHGAFGIAAITTPCGGVSVATKMFWFVSQDAAGHGLKLLSMAEAWARGYGVKRMAVDLPGANDIIMKRKGYRPVSTTYAKETADV